MTYFIWMLCDDIIGIAPFGVLCFFPLKEYFRFSVKKTAWMTTLVVLAICIADVAVDTYLHTVIDSPARLYSIANITYMGAVLLCFAWYIYTIKTIWQRKMFIFLFALVAALFSTSITNYVFTLLPASEEPGLYANSVTILVSLLISCVCVPPMCLFLKVLYMPIDRFIGKEEFLYLNVPLLILFVFYFFVFTFMPFDILNTNLPLTLLYFGLLLMIFVLYTVIFRMFRLVSDKQVANEKYIQAQYQIDIRDEQYRRISDNIENVRKQRHDLHLHMTTLRSFLKNGETEKAIGYLDQYLEGHQAQKLVRYSSNPVVNILVSHYADMAKEKGTAFSTHIRIPNDLPIQDTDISVILGNLLGNAIYATAKLPVSERTIKLNIIQRGNMLAITVDNRFNGEIQRKDGAYLSTKPGHSALGLSILTDIAEKYHGGVEFFHDEKMFYSSVMLKLD